ncbi:MAG: hypothetical protein HY819_17695 [Acidobacteria bacterium]|nr:hypothetical protein [Acidobacteriota bacterium]
MRFHSRVPVRIDFLGGITDCPPFSDEYEGAVINAGISRHIYATLELNDFNSRVYLISKDFNSTVESPDIESLEIDGNLDLLKVCLKRFEIKKGLTLTTYSDVPPGSGLGSSAALTIAILAVLKQAIGEVILPTELAELAFNVERGDLITFGGRQDQFGSALGGINYLTFRGQNVGIEQLRGDFSNSSLIDYSTILELEKRLLLFYTGSSHVSSDILKDMESSYKEEKSQTKEAMHKLKSLADKAREALIKSDLDTFGNLLNDNWYWHKKLHHSCNSPELDQFYDLAIRHGAIGGKTCGAGGGGCMVFYCKEGEKANLRNILERQKFINQEQNHRIHKAIDFVFDFKGLQFWQTN